MSALTIDATAPKSVRIVLVCNRRIGELNERIAQSTCSLERSNLLSERNDVGALRAYALAQDEYVAWLAGGLRSLPT